MAESALTRTMQAMSGWNSWLLALIIGIALPVVSVVGSFMYYTWRDAPVPKVTATTTLSNPAGTFVAVVEKVDNGMGFGQGAMYQEIHLLRHGDSVADHGTDSKTSIFFIEDSGAAPQLQWLDNIHLSISYQAGPDIRAVTLPGKYGVIVEFRKQVPQPPSLAH